MNATLTRVEMLRPDVRCFYFRPEQPMHYVAGQFVDISIIHDSPDDRGTSRQYTLSSSPDEPELAITSKFASGRSSTFKQALLGLQPGDTVSISQAMGDFVLPLDERVPLVFIAGGIGITPVRSMMVWLAGRGEQRDTTLHHIVRPEEQPIFMDELSTILGKLYQYESSVKDTDALSAAILNRTPEAEDAYFYIAGAERMVIDLRHGLRAAGIRPYQIIIDSFLGY